MDITSETIPSRQGQMTKDEEGRLVLVNPDGKAYAVDNTLSAVWSIVDGQKNVEQLTETIFREHPTNDKKEIQSVIEASLLKLESVNLTNWS